MNMKDLMKYISIYLMLFVCVQSQNQTLLGKIFAGYQGWFTTQDDGSGNGWTHYKMRGGAFAKDNCVIDYWPDTSQYEKKYAVPQMGSGFNLFSPYDYSTVQTHFRWMKENNIDGVFLQRFGSDIKGKGSNMWKFKNKVFENIKNAAKESGKLWSLMYDLSGMGPGQLKTVIMEDWKYLNTQYPNFRNDPSYIKHKGKPLITIWGVGFNDNRKYSLNQCLELVNFLKSGEFGGNSVMLGTPRYWRQGGKDAVTGSDLNLLHSIITQADVVSPWTVGRYNTISTAQIDARINVKADNDWCNQNKLTLMPVIFPGFSWHNLQVSGENPEHPGPYDQIPRKQNGVYFLSVQGQQVVKAGSKTVYVAMFDQMNEGTAIFKCLNSPPYLADGLRFVSQDMGPELYLHLTGQIGKLLHMKNEQQIEK